MRQDAIDIILRKEVKRRTFRKDTADHLMLDFNEALLIGTVRIAIKDSGSAVAQKVEFKSDGIREFRAVIGEYNREQTSESIEAQQIRQMVEDVNHGLRSIVLTKKSQQKIRVFEAESQQGFPARITDNRVHLNNSDIRMKFPELVVIL